MGEALASSFPFCIYEDGYFEAGRRYFTMRDNKPMYLLIYTISGRGTTSVGNRLRHIDPGQAVLLDCNRLHEYKTVSDEPWCFHWVHFDGAGVSGYSRPLFEELEVVDVDEKLRMGRYFEEIHQLASEANTIKKHARVSHIVAALLLIMVNSYYNCEQDAESGRNVITVACQYVEENLHLDLSVETLSDRVHLSKFYFIRLFKKHMGVSPYQYVQTTRINRAKELLITTNYRINEIAEMTGFSSPTRFTKLFSEMTGVTPTKFRRQSFRFDSDD
jgi:AraC-like DNA-binding protein